MAAVSGVSSERSTGGLARRLFGSLLLGLSVAVLVGGMAVVLLGRPPHTFRMASGAEGGMYEAFARDLALELAGQGFELQVIETDGSIENADLLRKGHADIALVQSGTEELADLGGSTALAEVFYEPVWLFYRPSAVPIVDGAPDFDGRTLGIGPDRSGTHAVAMRIIAETGMEPITRAMDTAAAVDALRAGTLDAAVFVMAANAPLIDELVQIEDLALVPVKHADGLSRRMPWLSAITLPSGVLDPSADEPPADVPMLAARATLMARESLHPDLARLVVKSLSAVMPLALVGDPEAFPSLERSEFTANEDARKFFLEGPTPLESFLPFEIASPLSRIYLVLLPLLVLAFPIWTLTKAGIAWYMRGRINNWYPRIHDAERRIDTAPLAQLREDDEALRALAAQLSTKTRVPAAYGAAYYDLRVDLDYVLQRLGRRIAELEAQEGDGSGPGDADGRAGGSLPSADHGAL